jgi:environmental stress-induced protein Ves
MAMLRCLRRGCCHALLVLLAACSNGRGNLEEPADSSSPRPPLQGEPLNFSVGGTVSGLAGSGLVLQSNGAGDLVVTADGPFAFAGRLASGATYDVTVGSQPTVPAQVCSVSNGSGSIASADVTDVTVNCVTGQFALRGNVSGLVGTGLVLQNNGGDDLAIGANGPFEFAVRLAGEATYNISVRSQPNGQGCFVSNASGRIAAADVGNIEVACASNQFTIGGVVSGLSGSGLILQLNRANDLRVASNGRFAFATTVPSGTAYDITVRTQPANPAQVCRVARAAGTVSGAGVNDVAVDCTTSSFSVGGTVSGLSGAGLVLQLDGGNDLPIASNGSFAFARQLPSGSNYRVTVRTQPSNPTQVCTVAQGSGTISTANVSSVRVTCSLQTYSIGGTVSGLLGSGLVLSNNGGDAIGIDSNGAFEFPGRLASGSPYSVTVRTQPSAPAQSCTVSNGRGTVGNFDIANVLVSCNTSDFTIGGTVAGLAGSGLVLRNNGADELSIDSNGGFTFDTALPGGARYDVTIAQQPDDPDQTCTVSNGSGTVGTSNITSVSVRCSTSGFTVGGSVHRLRGSGLVLQNNGGDSLPIGSNGHFRFPTPLASGQHYNVTIAQQPRDPEQTCRVEDGSGTIEDEDVDDVDVRCRGDDDDDDDGE